MYMRNKKYDNYNLSGFPPNYSGQYSPEAAKHGDPEDAGRDDIEKSSPQHQHRKFEPAPPPRPETEPAGHTAHSAHDSHAGNAPPKEEKKSLLGSIFGGKDGDKKSGLLGGLFNKDGGGILSGIELEDLILLAVIFFLLKDGFEDDIIIILALILLSG